MTHQKKYLEFVEQTTEHLRRLLRNCGGGVFLINPAEAEEDPDNFWTLPGVFATDDDSDDPELHDGRIIEVQLDQGILKVYFSSAPDGTAMLLDDYSHNHDYIFSLTDLIEAKYPLP